MTRKSKTALAFSLLLIFQIVFFPLHSSGEDKNTADSLVGGIYSNRLSESGSSDKQAWINGALCASAGVDSEWYIISLAQSGSFDFSKYESALLKYLQNNKVASATSREKYALALAAIGSNDEYILKTCDDSIGKQGLMSYVFGLHLLNNGYKSADFTQASLAEEILSLQLSDGGFAVMGDYGDIDCTAMTVQALAPLCGSSKTVKAAADKALSFLSGKQQSNGGYSSFNVENCESTAQVLLALSSMGIDCTEDSRFIKGGNTLIDAIERYRLKDGSFCHTIDGGTSGSATVQALYSLTGYIRLCEGKSAFYILDKASPATAGKPASDTPAVTTKQTTASTRAGTTSASRTGSTTTRRTSRGGTGTTAGKVTSSATEGSSRGGGALTTKKTSAGGTDTAPQQTGGDSTKPSASGSESVTSASGEGEVTDISSTRGERSGSDTENETETVTLSQQPGSESPSETAAGSDTKTASKTTADQPESGSKKGGSIKLYIYAGIGAAVLIGVAVLLIKKKRNIKSYIFIIAVGGVLCGVTCFLDIQSPEEYYAPASSVNESESAGSVTFSVDCLTLEGEDSGLIPEGCYFITPQSVDITEGETAFDALNSLARQNGIALDIRGSDDMIYVAAIGGIYEYDYGELSGWMYYVNGEAPSVNSSQYVLKDGDTVEWRYTREIGHDLSSRTG